MNQPNPTTPEEFYKEWLLADPRDFTEKMRTLNMFEFAQAYADRVAASPTPQNEIVPPVERHHELAQQIAREAGFDPQGAAFARCVGAVMRAWRPGNFWEAAASTPAPDAKEWQLYCDEGPINPGHKVGYPATYSICEDFGESHRCVAMTFGETADEAFASAELIVKSVQAYSERVSGEPEEKNEPSIDPYQK
jgi:hypothetical protein